MSLTRSSRFSPFALGVFSAAMAAVPVLSLAGDLTVAWSPAGPAASTSYRVFVGDRPGVYDRVVDAGPALRATLTDLSDGTVHYLAVKAFDAAGNESPAFSAELACMARPRVESVVASPLAVGGSAWVTLRGANFDREVQVRSNDARLRARATTLEPDGSLSVLVEAVATSASEGGIQPSAATFSVLNPCRRADTYFQAHPQAADVDASGTVDAADVRAVSAAIGTHRGETGFVTAADVDGDGVVDGRDLDRVIAGVRVSASAEPAATATAVAIGAPSAH